MPMPEKGLEVNARDPDALSNSVTIHSLFMVKEIVESVCLPQRHKREEL